MKKLWTKKIVIPVFISVLFITGSAFKSDFFEIAKQIEIFTTLFKEVNMNYVDETNPAELMDTAIKSMLQNLDPYTNFYNEQDVEASRINSTGDYTGIGANVLTLKDKLVIIEPYKDFPADKAGLKAGDEIIKVDNTVVADFKEDAGNLLQGSAGTSGCRSSAWSVGGRGPPSPLRPPSTRRARRVSAQVGRYRDCRELARLGSVR